MVGCASIEDIRSALLWNNASEEEKDYSPTLKNLNHKDWSRHCIYCGHCAPCPASTDIASVNKYLNLALSGTDGIPDTVKDHYQLLQHHASECLDCGECEKRCPFAVAIRKGMQNAVITFGN